MSANRHFSDWKKNHHLNHRRARFEQLEDRRLLAMMANWLAVTMPDSVAAEGVDGNTGTWRIWRSGIDDVPCSVNFRIDGATDFTLQTSEGHIIIPVPHTEDGVTYQTGMVYLPADECEVFLVLTPINDAKREQTETATIQLTAYSSAYSYNIYQQTQTITILDNDDWYVSVAATDAAAAEAPVSNPNYGVYTITRSNETDTTHYLDVHFEMTGTASISDYSLYNASGGQIHLQQGTDPTTQETIYYGTARIPSGSLSTTVELRPDNDALKEEAKTAVMTLIPQTSTSGLYDYSVTGTSAAVSIADNDDWYVSVTATDATAAESSASNPDSGIYTITRSNETDTTHALRVRFEMTGTASISEYSLFNASGDSIVIHQTADPTTQETIDYGFAVIPIGSLSTTVELRPNNDAFKEESKTAVMTLIPQTSPSGHFDYSVTGTSAEITIADNDDWCVSVTATDAIAEEGPDENPNYGVYTFTRSNETDTTHSLSVHFQMSGTATSADYTLVNSNGSSINLTSTLDPITLTTVYAGVAQIPAGSLSTTVELRPVDDRIAERDETATLTIVPNGTYYTIDQDDNSATVTIEESTVVTLTTIDDTALEPCTWISLADRRGAFRLTVETNETNRQQIYVQLDLSGTAQPGSGSSSGDYYLTKNSDGSNPIAVSNGQATVSIPTGLSQLDFYVIPNADTLYEPDETVILEIAQAYSGSSVNQIDYDDSDVETVEILQAPEFISWNEPNPLENVNTDSYIKYIDPKSQQPALLGAVPMTAVIPSGRTCRYAFYDENNGNSLTSSTTDPLLSINANTGAITVLREMTDMEKASAQVFTVKAYDSVYNDLYDLATLTIYALDYELVAYTPITTYYDPMIIPEERWKDNGVGIRRNNDYDNGTTVKDSEFTSSFYSDEDDLIRVGVNIDNTIPGLSYSIQRSNSALKFWNSSSKYEEYEFSNGKYDITASEDLWAEYTTEGNDNYTMSLVISETATNTVLSSETMRFRPFNSVTCAFVGEFQIAGNPTKDPGVNDWVIYQLKIGYDVHVWDDGFDNSDDPNYVPDCAANGSGNAFDEIVNAINNRGVTEVALIGYSHGGGSVYNLSYALSLVVWTGDGRNLYMPVFTSYIDAVQNEFTADTLPETRRPMNSLFHLNQYELNGTLVGPLWFDIHGDVTSGGIVLNTKNLGYASLFHGNIDEDGDVIFWLNNYFWNKVGM